MVIRRGGLAVASAVVLITTTLIAQQNPQNGQKLSDAQKKEIQAVIKVVDDAAAGKPAPNDFSLAWVRQDILKAQNNREYVPFTISFDPSKMANGTVSVYWRVMSKSAPEPVPAAAPPKDGKK